MAEKIVVTIDAVGRTSIDAQGFAGKSCTEATQQIEIAIGGGAVKRTPKPDMYRNASAGPRITSGRKL